MKIIKEGIANLERCIENDKVNTVGSMPIVMADAFYQSQKNDKELEDAMKEAEDIPEPEKVVGAEEQPVPKMPEEPKATLEENLFEDYDSDVRHYSDMLFDMIEEGSVDAAEIAKDLIYWCSEDSIKEYMRVNQLTSEFIDDEEDDYEESLKESKSLQDVRVENAKKYLQKAIDVLDTYIERKDESLTEDTVEDKYYAALDIPKGPERKKVAAERRQEFLKKHGLTDRKQEWKDAKGQDDPEEEEELFTRINDELFPYDMEAVKLFTKFPDVPASKRYHDGDIGTDYDGNILVWADTDEEFDFAKKVADAYGVSITEPKQSGKHKVVKIAVPEQ